MTTPVPSADPSFRRILVRGVNWLGDAVMTTPALQRLREALPDAHITLLTHDKLAALWQHHPSLNATITFSSGESPWSVARRLRAENFQAALVLPNSPRSALEVWLARVPQRIGYARPCWSWLLTQAFAPRPGKSRMSKRSVSEVRRLVSFPAAAPPPTTPRPPDRTIHQIHDYLHLASALDANPEPLPPKLEITAAEIQQTEHALLAGLRMKTAAAAPGQHSILLGLNRSEEHTS